MYMIEFMDPNDLNFIAVIDFVIDWNTYDFLLINGITFLVFTILSYFLHWMIMVLLLMLRFLKLKLSI
jgi:hypothetical protein